MIGYFMRGYEPGISVEIYLPKRTLYQPFLFKVLTEGMQIEKVRRHFLSPARRPAIVAFLGPGSPGRHYGPATVRNLGAFFYGYSIYEVDGVFKGTGSGQSPVIEERTQILRLIFPVNVARLRREADVATRSLPAVRAQISEYLRASHRPGLVEGSAGDDRKVYRAVERWRDQLDFFLFGYVVFNLCAAIGKLREHGHIAKGENEIWVSSFANIELDRVLKRRSRPRRPVPAKGVAPSRPALRPPLSGG